MKAKSIIYLLLPSLFLLFSCNPDCENYAGVQARITPNNRLPGEQILVTTSPANFLANRELYIEKTINGELMVNESTRLESEFIAEIKGRIATLPMDVDGNRNLYIEDRDCGGFIPLSAVNVVDEAYIAANQALFITPPRPQIIIPTIPTTSPTNLINTWFSPDNRDYCIWIVPELIKQPEGCYRESMRLTPGNRSIGPGTPMSGSWELSTNCDGNADTKPYHGNPVTEGVIDTLSGYVRITIDRTPNGLPVETYEGTLIEPTSKGLSAEDRTVTNLPSDCDPSDNAYPTKRMLILTSQTSGHQIVLFRQNLHGLEAFHGKPFCKQE